MKFATQSLLTVLAALSLSAAYLSAQEIRSEATQQPKLITPIRAFMPMSLHNTDIQEPKVVAMIQVSWNGRVEDLVVLEASHIDLIDRAESLIRRALFDPGAMQADESVRFELILPFQYPSEAGMQSSTTIDDIGMMIDGVTSKDRRVRFHQPGELDELPRILDRGQVYVPEDEDGEPLPGEASVEFYINHLGEVRLPRILSSSNEEMVIAAMATVSDMKFLAPTVGGQPAVTRVRMPYTTSP